MNAFRVPMLVDLLRALAVAEEDPDVRAVIVTGAGRAFSVGAALDGPDTLTKALAEDVDGHTPPTGYREPAGRISEFLFTMRSRSSPRSTGTRSAAARPSPRRWTSGSPVRRRVSGSSSIVAGGWSPKADRRGSCPRLVGIGRATDWILSGRVFGADEALAAGFLTKVVPADQVLAAAHEYAQQFVRDTSPTSVALAKHLIANSWRHDHPAAAAADESRAYAARVESVDAGEGIMSFIEHRDATFPPALDAEAYQSILDLNDAHRGASS